MGREELIDLVCPMFIDPVCVLVAAWFFEGRIDIAMQVAGRWPLAESHLLTAKYAVVFLEIPRSDFQLLTE